MIKESVILTDADGVLLNWELAFFEWMSDRGIKMVDSTKYNVGDCYGISREYGKGLIREFNSSSAIERLAPFRDSIKYIRKLHEEHGFVFRVITSLSKSPHAARLRLKNLHALFGTTAIDQLICIDTGADKDEELEVYRDSGCYWIEDKPENADLGVRLGLNSVLISHPHNASYDGKACRLENWKDIYKYVTGEL